MPYPDYTTGEVMDASAALLNDAAKTLYTYVAQLPYLKLAVDELQEFYQQNNIPVTNVTSAVIAVNAGVSEISFLTIPPLPTGLVEIQKLWYSLRDQNQFIPMTKREFLPHYLESVQMNPLSYWSWQEQAVKFLPSLVDNDIKLDYIKALFTAIVDHNTNLGIIDGKTFLEYRTAGLCSQFIGENKTRADELNSFAELGMDRAVGISTKGKQSIPIRRRPFRASYKRRGF